jgi:cell division protein FtsB
MKAPLTRFALLLVFLAAVSYAFVVFPRGMHSWREKQHLIQEKEKANTVLVQQVERQKERIRRLTDDPAEQELEIRRRLKLARPGEKVFITGDPEPVSPSKQPAR